MSDHVAPWVSDTRRAEQVIWEWISQHYPLTEVEEGELSELLENLSDAAHQAGQDAGRPI